MTQFKIVNAEYGIMVYEGSTAFWIVDLDTDEERCMGDGVDMYSVDDEDGFHSVPVCSDEFYRLLTEDIQGNGEMFREAYFG